jgi:hypothetical protein
VDIALTFTEKRSTIKNTEDNISAKQNGGNIVKKTNMIFIAALLSLLLTGCGPATESMADAANPTATTQKATENATEQAAETETESVTETEKSTDAATTESAAETTGAAENTTESATSAAAEQNEVFALNGPLGRYQGPDEFGSATFAASFEKEDLVKADDGTITLNVMIYRYELFSADDIETLKKGDVIWCLGSDVLIDTIEKTDSGLIVINGGIENGGRVLKTDDGAVYFESGMNDVKSYYEIGEKAFVLADDFVLTDSSDLDNPVTYTAEEFLSFDHGAAGFINANTFVTTSSDVITAIERVYIP